MMRRPPRSTLDRSSAASDVYKRQVDFQTNPLLDFPKSDLSTQETQAMYALKRVLLLAVFVTVAVAQSPDLLLSDTRISIHTLVREDVFAGLLANDLEQ